MAPNYQYKSEWMEFSTNNKLNFPAHFHLEMEFLYSVRGCIHVQVGDEVKIVNEGEFIIIFPNQVHAYFSPPLPKDSYFMVLNCTPDVLDEYTNTIMLYQPVNPVIAKDNLHPDVVHAIHALMELSFSKEQSRLLIKAYFLLFMAHVWPHLEFEPNNQSQISASLATQVVFYLAEHFTDHLTLEHVARHFCIDRYTLSRVFSKTIKCSFPDYLNQLRIEHAKKLLNRTDKRVSAIASECGFNNQQTFNRVFKSISAITPHEYRKQQWSEATINKINSLAQSNGL